VVSHPVFELDRQQSVADYTPAKCHVCISKRLQRHRANEILLTQRNKRTYKHLHYNKCLQNHFLVCRNIHTDRQTETLKTISASAIATGYNRSTPAAIPQHINQESTSMRLATRTTYILTHDVVISLAGWSHRCIVTKRLDG